MCTVGTELRFSKDERMFLQQACLWLGFSLRFCLFGQSSWADYSPLNSDSFCLVMTALAAFPVLKHLSSIFLQFLDGPV